MWIFFQESDEVYEPSKMHPYAILRTQISEIHRTHQPLLQGFSCPEAFPASLLSSSAVYHGTLGLSLTRKDIFTCWCLFFLPAVSAYRSDDAFKISFKAGLEKGLHSVL